MRAAIASVAAVLVLAGCAGFTAGPVVVAGTLVDQNNRPVPGARVVIKVRDETARGDTVPEVFSAETTTGQDGRFEFRFLPTAELKGQASANGGYVNFDLQGFVSGEPTGWSSTFVREVAGDTWSDRATEVRLVPSFVR